MCAVVHYWGSSAEAGMRLIAGCSQPRGLRVAMVAHIWSMTGNEC